jgi:hypothetical protein
MVEQYDPDVLQKYGDILYDQARALATWTALRYGVLAGTVTWLAVIIVFPIMRMRIDISSANITGLIAAVIAGLLGYQTGKVKAFALMLQAQQVLCQRQIELNTRRQDAAMVASQG